MLIKSYHCHVLCCRHLCNLRELMDYQGSRDRNVNSIEVEASKKIDKYLIVDAALKCLLKQLTDWLSISITE